MVHEITQISFFLAALVFGLLRTNLGLRGWFAGTVIGSVLG